MRKGYDGPASMEANLVKVCAKLKKTKKDINKSYSSIVERLGILDESRKNCEGRVEHMDHVIQDFVKEQEALRYTRF
jgi:hypothetical protein